MFVERNYMLWKDQEVIKWLKSNVHQVIQRVESNKESSTIATYDTVLRETFKDNQDNVYTHLLLSEYTDNISTTQLPPEIVEALRGGVGPGPRIYDSFREMAHNQQLRQIEQQRIPAATDNPIALFLNTLLPWTPTPNAPYQPNNNNNGQQQDANTMQQLVHFLQNMADQIGEGFANDGGGNEGHEHQE